MAVACVYIFDHCDKYVVGCNVRCSLFCLFERWFVALCSAAQYRNVEGETKTWSAPKTVSRTGAFPFLSLMLHTWVWLFFFFWVEQCLDCCLKGFGKPLLHRIVCRISAPKTGASGEVKNDFPKLGIWVGGQFFVRFFKARERVTYFLCFVVPHWLPSAGSQLSSWSWTEIVFMISTEDIELAATCDTLDCFLSSSKFVKCPLIICCQKSAAGGPLFCF